LKVAVVQPFENLKPWGYDKKGHYHLGIYKRMIQIAKGTPVRSVRYHGYVSVGGGIHMVARWWMAGERMNDEQIRPDERCNVEEE
jgi:hypothetical protein